MMELLASYNEHVGVVIWDNALQNARYIHITSNSKWNFACLC
jgi:hypothetical protein